MIFCVVVCYIFNFAEFIIVFGGWTLFRPMTNLLLIMIHIFTIIGMISFKRQALSYWNLGYVFWVGSLPPMLIETISAISAHSNYRRRA